MRIPTVGIPQGPNPGQSFAPISPTTYDKVGQAGARLGETIEGVATDLPVRIKTAIDAGTLAKAQTAAEVHFQSFADSLHDGENPENGDPSTYLRRWQDAQTRFTQSMSDDSAVKSLSPAARIEYRNSIAKWQMMATQQVGHLATEKALQNAAGDIRTSYEMNIMSSNPEAAQSAIEKGMSTGIINPEEGKQMIFQIPMKTEYNQAVGMMSRDPDTGGGPIVLEHALQTQNDDGSFKFYPHVVGQPRESLVADAVRNARLLQSQTAQDYAGQAAAGQQANPDQVTRDVQLGKLTRAQATAIMKPVRVFDPNVFRDLASQITAFDPKDDPSHAKEANIWGALNIGQPDLSPQAAEHLTQMLKGKLDAKGPLNSETAKFGFSAINEGLARNVFGKFKEDAEAPSADNDFKGKKGYLDEKAYQDASQRQADTLTAFSAWLQSEQKPPYGGNGATPADASKFIYGFQADAIRAHASSILGGKNPQTIDLDVLLKRYEKPQP